MVIVLLEVNTSYIVTFQFFREEAVRSSNTPVAKSSVEMENHVFQKAKTRVEYSLYTCITLSMLSKKFQQR